MPSNTETTAAVLDGTKSSPSGTRATASMSAVEEATLLSRLPLPRTSARPSSSPPSPPSPPPPPPPPTIRILAVADVDLRSAARLAEYALREREDIVRTEMGGRRPRPRPRPRPRRRRRRSLTAAATATAAAATATASIGTSGSTRGSNGSSCGSDYESQNSDNEGHRNANSSDAEDSSLDLSLGAYEIRTRPLGGGAVDLCVACGPFVHQHQYHHHRHHHDGIYSQYGGSDIAVGGIGGSAGDGSVGSSASGSCSCGDGGSFDDDHHEHDEDAGAAEDADDDASSSSSGSSGSSGSSSSAGGYDNTGGFGYRASSSNISTNNSSVEGMDQRNHNRSDRSSSRPHQNSHICARHLRQQQQQQQQRCPERTAAAARPTAEQDADAEGITMSTLSQLENIVCRVLYIPGRGDPPSLYGRTRDDAGGATDGWDGPNDSDNSRDGNDAKEGGEGGGGRKATETVRQSHNGSLSTSGAGSRRTEGGSISMLHRDTPSTAHRTSLQRLYGAISSTVGASAATADAPPRTEDEDDFGGDGHGDNTIVPGPRHRVEEARHRSPYGDLITEAELTPHKRLTPNSRNVHRRWVQLGPGLGVAGLARDADLARRSGDGGGRAGGERTGERTISFDQSRYERALGSLLSLSRPSRNHAIASSKMLTSKPSQAIVLTNLPGENEHITRGRSVQAKRRGKRDKDSRSPADIADYFTGDGGIPIAYRDWLATAAGTDEEENQILLKLASPPSQSDYHHHHGFSHTPAGDKKYIDQPWEYEVDGVKLVMPGSLRKSGDFALIDVALCKDDKGKSAKDIKHTEVAADLSVVSRNDRSRGRGTALNNNPQTRGRKLSPPSFRWRVHRVQFRSMDERGR